MRRLASRLPVLAAALLAFAALSVPAYATTESDAIATARSVSKAFTEIAQKATPAVVSIRVEQAHPAMMPGGSGFPGGMMPMPEGHVVGQGSGVLISEDGLILTNNHVVENARRLDVRLADGRDFHGKVVGTDPQSDLAVVRIEGNGFPYLKLADSDKLEIGEWVIAIGSPFGLSNTVTVGIVSAKSRSEVGIAGHEDFIQTDAAINPGNSGGPLVNLDGDVVGINSAILSRSGGNNGIGFAIPSNLAKAIEQQLVTTGHIVRGFLGVVVQDLTPDLASSFGIKNPQGALVDEVSDGTPAAAAGVKQGDVILAVDGKTVASPGDLRNEIALKAPGTHVDLLVYRDGKEEHLTADLAQQPGETANGTLVAPAASYGMEVQPLTPELAQRLGYDEGKGVLVAKVAPDGAAAAAGIEAGNVILSVDREPVNNLREFEAAVAKAKDGRILLQVRNAEHTRFVVLSKD
jgi:serine protease Do